MEYLKEQNKYYPILPAACFSFLLHLVLGAVLFLGMSSNLTSSPDLNGLNLVWVSLDQKNNDAQINNIRTEPAVSIAQKVSEKETLIEQPAVGTDVSRIYATGLDESYGASKNEKPAFAVTGTAGNNAHETGFGTNTGTGDATGLNSAIAYPLYKENTPPVYPEIARVRGYEGIVLVSAEVLPSGRVGELKVRKSSGYAILDQSAIKAVKPWKFEPARKSGNPFTAWVELPIKFILNNENSKS